MAKTTFIDWSDSTFNPFLNCDETSNPGCKECYAIHRVLKMRGLKPGQIQRTSEAYWKQPLRWQAELETTGDARTVFVSLTDPFHPGGDPWRDDFWALIRKTPNLIWILLTQRIGNALHRMPADWGDGYPNVWLGISASDQLHLEQRAPTLFKIPAATYVLSLEPFMQPMLMRDSWLDRVGWVIAGGTSGDNWKQYPLYPSWVRAVRDQCVAADIPFFFKQLGGPASNYRNGDQAILDGQLWQEIPESTAQPLHIPGQLTLL